jgi:hypothetical protein
MGRRCRLAMGTWSTGAGKWESFNSPRMHKRRSRTKSLTCGAFRLRFLDLRDERTKAWTGFGIWDLRFRRGVRAGHEIPTGQGGRGGGGLDYSDGVRRENAGAPVGGGFAPTAVGGYGVEVLTTGLTGKTAVRRRWDWSRCSGH